ncbi:uncharacterized protein LODBEIA_P58600 [Lodderomyces beijingensis]|uniref:CS domain-containing protein n=1 Tax=Lodderomyces beijingensis TaxID=1775926 RepID=A0ABP0ZU21_9ASCO
MSYYYQPQNSSDADLSLLWNLLRQEQFNNYNHPRQHQQHQQQYYQYPVYFPQQQRQPSPRPRVVKKLETEDEFQIQIHKPFGNFNNYEVQVIKQKPPLIKLVIVAPKDNFRSENTFNLNYIDVDNINWTWYKQENILCLNVPKKLHYIHSNVEDIWNYLFGDGQHHGASFLEPEERELQFNKQGHEIVAPEAEDGEDNEDSLEQHEKLLQQAADALKTKEQKQLKFASGSSSGRDSEQKKAKAKAEAEAERQRKQEAAEAQQKEIEEKAARQAAEVARKKQEKEAARQAAIQKKRQALAQQQQEYQDKIKQAQQELENLVRQQQELEREDKPEPELEQVEQKQDQIKTQIHNDATAYFKDEDQSNALSRQQQQDFINQFFGFNLGPVVPQIDQLQNFKSKSTKPEKPEKPTSLSSSHQAASTTPTLDSSNTTPATTPANTPANTPASKANGALNKGSKNEAPLQRRRHSPKMEDVEDEESILWKKRFDH